MFDRPNSSARCAATVCVLLFSASLSALEPTSSTLIDALQIDLDHRTKADDSSVYLGTGDCAAMLDADGSVTFTFSTVDSLDPTTEQFVAAYRFSVDLDDATSVDCNVQGTCTTLGDDRLSTTVGTITVTVPFSELTGKASAGDCSGFETEYFVRVHLNENGTPESTTSSPVDARVVVDTVAPSAVTTFSASATEENMEVEWGSDLDDETTQIKVYYSTEAFSGGTDSPGVEATATTLVVADSTTSGKFTFDTPFAPGTTLYVAVSAGDDVGNFSSLSEAIEVQVVETDDFWEHYRKSGGSEDGGHCSASRSQRSLPTGLWIWLVIAAVGIRSRARFLRRKS